MLFYDNLRKYMEHSSRSIYETYENIISIGIGIVKDISIAREMIIQAQKELKDTPILTPL